ncbi:MAG: hypothetical protein LKG11_06220 [Bacilli bacterium]|jgi:hypothetical protein|nr:hypothetical protein [Bacilli bacterium]
MSSDGNPIEIIMNRSVKYDRIKNSEKRPTSVVFGVKSVIASVFVVLFALGIASCLKALSDPTGTWGTLLAKPIAIGGLVLLAIALLLVFLCDIVDLVFQLKLNRRPIGWVSLLVFLGAAIGSVVVVVSAL